LFDRHDGPLWDRALAATEDWVVVPSKGALLPGWLLVVPRMHSLCSGAVSDQERNALFDAAKNVGEVVGKAFGTPSTIFEHGPAAHGDVVGCGINHTHLHVVPLGFSLTAAAAHHMPNGGWRSATLGNIQALHVRSAGYLAVLEPDRGLMVAELHNSTSQALRKVIATEIGAAHKWDYRAYDGIAEVTSTVRRLSGFQMQRALEAATIAA
jgi:diadenosine tetraphosphate (Ap4A) HIT family hydrolase